jgi:hypothetical protein
LELLRKESVCRYNSDSKRPLDGQAADKEEIAVILNCDINNTPKILKKTDM